MTYSELLRLDKQMPATPKLPGAKPSKAPQPKPETIPEATVDTTIPRYHDATIPSDPRAETASMHAAKMPTRQSANIGHYHGATARAMARRIRRAVHRIGKEAATHRFTREEKDRLAEVIYHSNQRGVKTCENEVVRIGLNWLLEDHAARGERSILSLALKALRA